MQARYLREVGDDVLGNAVGEIVLIGIAAHVGEGQNGDEAGVAALGCRAAAAGTLVDVDGIDLHWLLDVLQCMLALQVEANIKARADLVADGARHADATRLRKLFQPGRDVDTIAEDIAVLENDVAKVDADAELDALFLRHALIAGRHVSLDLDGAGNGIHNALELDKHSVACQLESPALVVGDPDIDQFTAVTIERLKSSGFIDPHQTAVAHDVGSENCAQPSFQYPLHENGLI